MRSGPPVTMLRDVRVIRVRPVVEVFDGFWRVASETTASTTPTGPDSLVPPTFGEVALRRCAEVAREAMGSAPASVVDPHRGLVRSPLPQIWTYEDREAFLRRPLREHEDDLNIVPTISLRDVTELTPARQPSLRLVVVSFGIMWRRGSVAPSESWARGDAFAIWIERADVPARMLALLETLTRDAVTPLRYEPPLPSRQ